MKKIIAAMAVLFAVTLAGGVHATAPSKSAVQKVAIEVTSKGFQPDTVLAKAGVPLVLEVTRKTDRTCAKDIVIKDLKIRKPLPLDKTVEVRLTPAKKGNLRFACAMDMVAGVIVVR